MNTKKAGTLITAAACAALLTCCHSNPHNTFGGPSDHPKDTAAVKRDTSSAGTRTDR